MSEQYRGQPYREPPHRPPPSNIPIPDPSVVTEQAIDRAKNELRIDYTIRIDALKESVELRRSSLDKTVDILNEDIRRMSSMVDRETQHLKGLFEEKFKSLQDQIKDLKICAESDKQVARDMVDKALANSRELAAVQNAANKEAVNKSEAATVEQIRSLGMSLAKQIEALGLTAKETQNFNLAQITDLKTRLDRGEGTTRGATETRVEGRAQVGSITAIIGAILGAVSIIFTIILQLSPHNPAVPVTVAPTGAVSGSR